MDCIFCIFTVYRISLIQFLYNQNTVYKYQLYHLKKIIYNPPHYTLMKIAFSSKHLKNIFLIFFSHQIFLEIFIPEINIM